LTFWIGFAVIYYQYIEVLEVQIFIKPASFKEGTAKLLVAHKQVAHKNF